MTEMNPEVAISAAISSFQDFPRHWWLKSNTLPDFYSLPCAQTIRQTPMLIRAELRNQKSFCRFEDATGNLTWRSFIKIL